ncbi:MAG: hypothetical protein KAR22_00370, partial [Gammaproteobacteria bacterium]|nr:hypothetical protein [Gammaproteobacteria bacterium]
MPPYELVEIILSNGAAGAQATVLVAVVVGAETPVVVELSFTRAGRRSVVAIATTRTCHEALEERGFLRTAGSESLIIAQPTSRQLEHLLRDNGRNRDFNPFAARLLSRDMSGNR